MQENATASLTPPETHAFRPPNYRPHIDGLRAFAVLAVVGFHAFPSLLPGGFIGVDVFFVISGYLISGLIYKELDRGGFDYAKFYRHRIRRIFPALAVVLGATLLFGAWQLFPGAAANLGLQTLAATLFSSNILLWTESGYFDAGSDMKPLLHMWSLGIEEQFYFFWPLLLGWLGTRKTPRLALLATLGIGSFVLCSVLLTTHPVAAFYLPFSRFWELLVGAALALFVRHRAGHAAAPRWASEAVSIGGGLLLLIGLLTVRSTQPFPGWRALVPTLGAAAILASGHSSRIGRWLFSNPLAIFFGAISYPLYLWHWPLLTFPNILDGSVSRTGRIAAVLAAVLLAWLTYRYIESPIRSGAARRMTSKVLCGWMSVVGLAGLAAYGSHGWPQRYPVALRNVALAGQGFDYAVYRERECFLMVDQAPVLAPSCVQPKSAIKDRILLLWGDSHAASLYPGLLATAGAAGSHYRLAQYTASGCPPVLGLEVASRPNCRALNDQVLHYVVQNKSDTVLILASWSLYRGQSDFGKVEMADLVRTVGRLRDAGAGRVIVLGPLPRWLEPEPDVILRLWDQAAAVPEKTALKLDPSVFAADAQLEAALRDTSAEYVSVLGLLCAEGACRLQASRDGQTYPMAWDDAHLTVPGSVEVARLLAPRLGASDH